MLMCLCCEIKHEKCLQLVLIKDFISGIKNNNNNFRRIEVEVYSDEFL